MWSWIVIQLKGTRRSEKTLFIACWATAYPTTPYPRGYEITEVNFTLFWALSVGVGGRKDCQRKNPNHWVSCFFPKCLNLNLMAVWALGPSLVCHDPGIAASLTSSLNTINMLLLVHLHYFLIFMLTSRRTKKIYTKIQCRFSFLLGFLPVLSTSLSPWSLLSFLRLPLPFPLPHPLISVLSTTF